MKTLRVAALVLLGLSALAGDARADGYVSPFAGVVFGGDAGGTFNQAAQDRNRGTFGVDVGGMSGGVLGVELDVGYTKNFFGTGGGFSDNSILTVMPTAIIGIPIGGQRGAGLRPYATAGLGLIRRNLDFLGQSVFDGNKLAYGVGFGAMGFFATRVGIKGDIRYFRSVQVDEIGIGIPNFQKGNFAFSRASVGVVFRY